METYLTEFGQRVQKSLRVKRVEKFCELLKQIHDTLVFIPPSFASYICGDRLDELMSVDIDEFREFMSNLYLQYDNL